MPSVTPHSHSPNIGNYFIGRGYCTIQLEGESAAHDAGNITSFEFEVKPTMLDHFSSRVGVRKKDFVAVTELSATLRVSMEEITARNMAMYILGDQPTESPPGTFTMDILSKPQIYASFQFVGTNSVGAQYTATFPLVLLTPQKAIQLISSGSGAWGTIDLQGDVLFDDHTQTFGTIVTSGITSP